MRLFDVTDNPTGMMVYIDKILVIWSERKTLESDRKNVLILSKDWQLTGRLIIFHQWLTDDYSTAYGSGKE